MPARTWHKPKAGNHCYNGDVNSRGRRIISKIHRGFGDVSPKAIKEAFDRVEKLKNNVPIGPSGGIIGIVEEKNK